MEDEQEDMNVYFLIEDNLKGCPRVKLEIVEQQINAAVDSGAEVSLISEELFNGLMNFRLQSLYSPVMSGILVSAVQKKNQEASTGEIQVTKRLILTYLLTYSMEQSPS